MEYTLVVLDNYMSDYLVEEDGESKGLLAAAIEKQCGLVKIVLYNEIISCDNEVALLSFYNLHMQRLVELSDLVYEDDFMEDNVSSALLALIYGLKKALPSYINRDIALPKSFRAEQYIQLKAGFDLLIAENCSIIYEALKTVIYMPLDALGDLSRKVSWFHFIWLKRFMHPLSGMLKSEDCQAAVISLMISMDFNGQGFGDYCKKIYLQKARDCDDQDALDYVLNLELKALVQLPELSKEPFYQEEQSIRESLKVWLNEEISFQTEFDANLFQENDKPVRLNRLKLRYKLTVDQLAFWQKLQYDGGLFDEPDLNVLSEKMAYNFSSANQLDISASSIKSKFYPKDHKIITPLYQNAEKMIEILKSLLVILEKMIAEMQPFLR